MESRNDGKSVQISPFLGSFKRKNKKEKKREKHLVKIENEGIVEKIDAYKIGVAALKAGAGREKKEDDVDTKAGIRLLKVEGEEVKKKEPIALVYTKKPSEPIMDNILSAYSIGTKTRKETTKILEKW